MSRRILSVFALVHYLKQKLDQDTLIQEVLVQGEISNFTNHRSSGHWYFTLKDTQARIACVMFARDAQSCRFVPKEGDKVMIQARTSLYESSGQLQLYVSKIQQDGLGDLYLQYEQRKKKLYEEGLFDLSHKKKIPEYPFKIGLITGRNTAAREDVITTLQRRWAVAQIEEYPVLVQGETASKQIVKALKQADKEGLDVILLVRGGGSIEDLWAFNDEELARVIYTMETPLITGVGHEVDTTIVDYVSDLRAATPTAAAEQATPDLMVVYQKITFLQKRLIQGMLTQIQHHHQHLNSIRQSRFFTHPQLLFERVWLQLDYSTERLSWVSQGIQNKRSYFEQTKNALIHAMVQSCNQTHQILSDSKYKLMRNGQNRLLEARGCFQELVVKLDAYSPLKSLSRGYGLVYQDKQMITKVAQLDVNHKFTLVLQDGNVIANVLKKEIKDDKKENI